MSPRAGGKRRRSAGEHHDGAGRARHGLLREVDLLAPVGLEKDSIDLLEVDGFGAVSDGLEQGAEAEVPSASMGVRVSGILDHSDRLRA